MSQKICEKCNGTGHTSTMYGSSSYPKIGIVMCSVCNGTGYVAARNDGIAGYCGGSTNAYNAVKLNNADNNLNIKKVLLYSFLGLTAKVICDKIKAKTNDRKTRS